MLRAATNLAGRARHHAMAICTVRSGPLPRSAMGRSGFAIGAVFVFFLLLGRPEAAALGAFFTNFLCFSDRADHLVTRLWVQVLGALLFAGLGAVGMLLAGNTPLILLVVFCVAQIAGYVHGSTPGLEALPRFALCCLIVTAFLPLDWADTVAAVIAGSIAAVVTVVLDDLIHNGRRGAFTKRIRAEATFPGPLFSLVYGLAAAGGLAIGIAINALRPYWVVITTLIVMQPDRRANTVRVFQRFLGTLVGVVVAFLIVRVVPPFLREGVLVGLAVVLPFVWPLGYDRNYGLGVAVLSSWVLLMIDLALPSTALVTPLFVARLSDTAIGCTLALAGSLFVYETGERDEGG